LTTEEVPIASQTDTKELAYQGLSPFDASKYQDCMEDIDLPDEKKVELLQTLWWIMATFVDLGFGVDSVQNYLPALKEFPSEFAEDGLEETIEGREIAAPNGASKVEPE